MDSITLPLDMGKIKREAEIRLESVARAAALSAAERYFNKTFNPLTDAWGTGPGTLELEKFLDDKFGSPEFQAQMEKFFNENFNKIFQYCMTKAIQHYCNKKAFEMMKEKETNDPAVP